MLQGKVALITGASRGIGQAIATRFSEAGATLHLCARSGNLSRVADGLVSSFGNEIHAHAGDVTDDVFLKATILAIKKKHGRLDVLVNNAGILQQGLLGMISVEETRKTLEVNAVSVINWTQFSLKILTPGASIINIASFAGTHGMEGVSAYAASKGAVIGFTLAASKELCRKNIRVNAIAPGFIDTEITRGLSFEWYQKRIASIGMGRVGTPEDVAKVALFLASDLSSYMTGQVLGVDGGMTS